MQPDVLVTGKHGVLRPRLFWIYLLCGLLACVGPRPALGHTTEGPPTEGPTETNCETPCPDKCLCSAVPKACTVDCTGQGLRQVPSPTGLPIPTKKLILSENNVSTIAEDAFKSLQNLEELIMDRNNISSLPNRVFNNLSSLKILNLTYNCLESLEVNSFEGLTSLEELLLQGNKLNSVPDDLFADSSAIAVLSFSENLLTTLPENVFQNLTSLQELDLSKNRLTSMSKQLFTGLHMLHTLDLSSNELDNLTYGVFDDLVASNSSLTSLSLGSNPYRCTCDLFWLPLWLSVAEDANITLPDRPNITCVDPGTNTVKHVADVDFSPLNCKPCKLSAGLLAILRKHRHSKVHWHEKHSLSRRRRNAQSYGACYTDTDTGEGSLVFFQYEQSGSHDIASCNAICYAQGYGYGGLPDAQDTCYCGELAETFFTYTGCKLLWCEWDHSFSVSISSSICEGHLRLPSSFRTFPTFHFANTRTYYSINEDIDFTLTGILTDSTESYIWDLGDGSPQINKTGLSVNHKYGVDGTYALVVEGRYNGTAVVATMPVVIVTPVTGVTLTCPPSHYSGSDTFSVTLEARTGYNISVQWLVSDYGGAGFITDEPDADYRQYFMVGSVVFDSVDIPTVNKTAQAGAASANTKRLLLFPGMWFQHTGLLSTWEFVAAPGASNIHLQVYRPTCPGFGSYLHPPGCPSLPSPYATCVSGQFCNATDSCPAGQQYCYLSSSCKAITEPCSQYDTNQGLPPRYINTQPNYTLAGETNLHISVTERTLVRVDISQQPITVLEDDIIGIQFDSEDALQYYNASTSEWVQSALYMEQDDWVQMWTEPEAYSDTWFDYALFEIRAMYTVSETFSYSPSNADIIKARPVGTVTFAAIVENPVTKRTSRNCTITFEDAIEGAKLIFPIPGADGIIHLETGKEYNFVVMITKGTDVSATFRFWSELHVGIPFQDTCPDDIDDIPQDCTPTSNTTSYAFYAKQYDGYSNSFPLTVTLTNLVSQVQVTSNVQADEVISGVAITSSSPRTAVGIQQTFTVTYDTGTSVNSYQWYIDDTVVLNADTSSFFYTFSEATTHTIFVEIENPHGSANASLDVTIDPMEAMQDLTFVNPPALVAAGDAVTFTAMAAVDSYYDFTWQWDYGDGQSDTTSSSAPYTGATPIANTYLVQHEESVGHTFANPGIYTVKVLVFNDYGNTSAQHTVEIRPKLTGVSVTAEPVAVERGQPVTLTATPQGATEDVTYRWNFDDSSSEEGSSNVSVHTYAVAATYNVSVTADNGVSNAVGLVLVKAQVKVTGLELSTAPAVTEMNEVTTLTATVQTGTDLLFNSDMGDGFVLYNLTSPFLHTYTYPGNYTANVTAFNDISSEWETVVVMVISSFTINNVSSGSCTELGKITTFEASITTDNIGILQFTWYFGDGNATTVLGSPVITHRYGTTGNFTVRLKVENTQKVLWETIYACVQEPISGVFVTNNGPTALGQETTVNVVLTTGSHYTYSVNFGDGVHGAFDGGSEVTHVFASAGSFMVNVTVHNEVTTTTLTTTVRVVQEIAGISITHNGTNQDFVRSQSSYTYQAGVAAGTEVHYSWNFGYDQAIVSGDLQTYQYDAPGIYIVTVNASNDVSSSSNSKIITVQDTVQGLHLSSNATAEILVGSSVVFDADITAGTDPLYTWKLCSTCTSFVGSDSITRPFAAVGTFEVSVNVANEVSSEEASTTVTVIYPVKGAKIYGELSAGSLHAAGQAYTFSANVTQGRADHYQWEVTKYGSHIITLTGSEVHVTFPDVGQYDVSVVVSNSVSDSAASVTVDVIELVTDVVVTASKTMASNEEEVTFTAVSSGTNLTFVWNLGDGSPNIETTEPQVQHQYDLAGTFLVTVNVSNDLSSQKSTALPVEILERISGLDLETTTTDTNNYAGQDEFTNFVATLTSGSNVTYSWTFIDGGRVRTFNGLDLDEVRMVYNSLGNQTASLSADNDVSHQNITRTIVVQKRPAVHNLRPNASYVETLEVISFTHQVEGTDLEYELDFGDGPPTIGNSLPSPILHSYTKTGAYTVSLKVRNYVGQEEYIVSITVLQRIEGLAINTNCNMPYCTNGFLSLGEELEYAAKWEAGNNITFTWEIIQADGTSVDSMGESMTFAPAQLGSQSVSLRAENWLNSATVSETFTVQEEIVSAQLITSNIINLYENATVSFRIDISSGSDVYYEWTFNDGFPVFETSVSNQNRTFPTAGDYLVRVKAFNNISLVVKEITITIRELMCQEPTVERVGLSTKEILRSSEAYLEVDTNTFDCTKYRVIHQWTVYQGSQCGVNNITLPSSVNRATTRLVLPEQTLDYDLYCVEYQIVYQDTPVLSVVRFSLRVKASPLTPLIKGGTERTQSSTQELLLDGTSSFDPDTPDRTGLTFQWYCQAYSTQNGQNDPNACGAIQDWATLQHKSLVAIPATTLPAGTTFLFNLTVEKQDRVPQSARQTIVVNVQNVPSVFITCVSCISLNTMTVSWNQHVTVTGECQNCSPDAVYKWDVKADDNSALELTEATTTTGDSSKNLVLRPGALASGHGYTFTLTVTDGSQHGYATLHLDHNEAPSGGLCTASASDAKIIASYTTVTFDCSGWNDNNNIYADLLINIIVMRQTGQNTYESFLLYRGTQNTYQSTLPVGLEEWNYNVRLVILVEDRLGAQAEAFNSTMAVEYPEQTDLGGFDTAVQWLSNRTSTDLQTAAQDGDIQQVLGSAVALVTILNEESELAWARDANDGEFSDRESVRSTIIDKVTSLSASITTKEDIRQFAAVLSLCTKYPKEMITETSHQGLTSVLETLVQIQEEEAEEGQVVDMDTATNIMNIISNVMEAANLNIHEPTTAVSVSFSETHRKAVVTDTYGLASRYNYALLKNKVEGEEDLVITASSVSSRSKLTQASIVSTAQNISGSQFVVPSSVLGASSEVVSQIEMVFDTNPFTWGHQDHISSQMMSLQFARSDRTEVSVNDLPEESRIKAFMVKGGSRNKSIIGGSVVGSPGYDPSEGLNTTDGTVKAGGALNVIVNITDCRGALYIQVRYNETVAGSTEDFQSVIVDYVGTKNRTLVLRQDLMSHLTGDHRDYTLFFPPSEHAGMSQVNLTITNNYQKQGVKVSVGLYCSSCLYYNQGTEQWDDAGVTASPESTATVSVCYSSHLTSFGAVVLLPPNAITLEDFPTLEDIAQNPVALITCMCWLVVFLVAGFVVRKLDLRDIRKVAVVPLCGRDGPYKYEISVMTGMTRGSGTTAHVGLNIFGSNGKKSGRRVLLKPNAFLRNSTDVFQIAVDGSLGDIIKIKIWHDNTGLDPSWNLKSLVVHDIQTDKRYHFVANSWFSLEEPDGFVEKDVYVASPDALKKFSTVFKNETARGLSEQHLWLSILERPARNRFTRVQRVTCLATLVYSFMCVNAMWYGLIKTNTEDVEIWYFAFSWEELAVGIISNLMVFPINLLIVTLFRKIKSKVKATDYYQPVAQRAQTAQTIEMDVMCDTSQNGESLITMSGQTDPFAMFDHRTSSNNNMKHSQSFRGAWQDDDDDSDDEAEYRPRGGKMSIVDSWEDLRKDKRSLEDRNKLWSYESIMNWSDTEQAPSQPKKSQLKRKKTGRYGGKDIPGIHVDAVLSDDDDDDSWGKTAPTQKNKKSGQFLSTRPQADGKMSRTHSEDDLLTSDEFWSSIMDETSDQKDSSRTLQSSGSFTPRSDADLDSGIGDPIHKTLEPSIHSESDQSQQTQTFLLESDTTSVDSSVPPQQRRLGRPASSSSVESLSDDDKGKWLLPYWFVYIAYLLCAIIIAGCMVVIIMYGQAFGRDQATKWVLSMFLSLIQSMFLMEPIRVILIALFLASISKPTDHNDEDDLVDRPVVENQDDRTKSKAIRAPYGYGLLQAREEARKVRVMYTIIHQCIFYLLFIMTVLVIAYNDNDLNTYRMTHSIEDSLVKPQFGTSNRSFLTITQSEDWWEYMDSVLLPTLLDTSQDAITASSLEGVVLGGVRLRQIRNTPETCMLQRVNRYPNLWTSDWDCYSSVRLSTEDSSSYGEAWSANQANWNYSETNSYNGLMYYGRDGSYSDNGYILDLQKSYNASITALAALNSSDWIDRGTRAVFVEFSLYNPNVNLFSVVTLLLELPVTGVGRASRDIKSGRFVVYGYGVDLLMIMQGLFALFLLYYVVVECCQLKRHGFKPYLRRFQTYYEWAIIIISASSLAVYIHRLLYTTGLWREHLADKTRFISFFHPAYLGQVTAYLNGVVIFLLMIKVARQMRFRRQWSIFGKALRLVAWELAGCFLIFLILILIYAQLGYLLFSNHSPYFTNMWMSVTAMVAMFRGQVDLDPCRQAHPVLAFLFFTSYILVVLCIIGRLFGAVLIHGFTAVRKEMHRPAVERQDYEMVEFMIKRFKMWTGLAKPKAWRHNVKFLGMDRLSTRSSRSTITTGGLSHVSTPNSPISLESSGSVGLGHLPEVGQMDPNHLEYLLDRLTPTVDAVLSTFDRLRHYVDDDLTFEEEPPPVQRSHQRTNVTKETPQKKNINISRKDAQSAPANKPGRPNRVLKASSSWTQGIPGQEKAIPTQRENSWTKGSSTSGPPSRKDQSSAWRQNKEVSWADRYKDNAWGSSSWTRKGASDPWGDRRREDSWEQSHPRSTANSPARKKEHSWSSDYGSSRRQGSRGSVPQRPTQKKPAW